MGLLVADLHNANRNSPDSPAATPSFTAGAAVAHTARARPSAVAIHYLALSVLLFLLLSSKR